MQRIETSVKTSVVLTQAQMDKLDQIAKRYGMKRAQVHRIVLEAGLDSYSVFEGTGMAKLTDLGIRLKRVFRNYKQPSLI